MIPAERLDAAEQFFDQVVDNLPLDESAATGHALIAIGRLLQELNNRQAAQVAQQAGS